MYFNSILLYNNPITETILYVNKMKNFFIKDYKFTFKLNLINGIDKLLLCEIFPLYTIYL